MTIRRILGVVLGLACGSGLARADTGRHLEWYGEVQKTGLSGYSVAGVATESLRPASGPNQNLAALRGIETFARLGHRACALGAQATILDSSAKVPAGQRISKQDDCDDALVSASVPDGMAIRGIQVCSSMIYAKDIVGLRLWYAAIGSEGQLTPMPSVLERKKEANCEWRGKQVCPAGHVAVRAIAHSYGASKTYTGLTLECAKLRTR